MAVTTQGTVDLERKSKKRKKRDKRHTKKKTILIDQNASEVATEMDSNFGAHNSSRKEENRTSRIKTKDVVIDSKRQKRKKRNKTVDEGEASQAENISEEIEPMEDWNKRKKKKAAEDQVNDTKKEKMKKSEDTVLVENQNGKIKSVSKRKKNKKDNLGLVGSLDEKLATTCTNMPSTSKKKKFIGSNTDEEGKDGALKTSKRKNPIESSENIGSNAKVVRFSDRVEILSLTDNCRWTEKLKDHSKGKKKVGRLRRAKVSSRVDKKNNQTKKVNAEVIRGKRFSKEEDEMVKNSVLNYIETHQLGEMGLEMVLKCSKYPEVRECWKEIGKALPLRPYLSVYNQAHILFESRKSCHLTPEKIVFVKEFHKHDQLGKHRICVKDTNTKKELTSPMVAEEIWADVDDYRLIISLHELDAVCLEDVDWDYLLDHRSGDVCRKRWNQIVRYICEHGSKSFGEQVEILSKRYCPDLLQDRVSWDGKTPADKIVPTDKIHSQSS